MNKINVIMDIIIECYQIEDSEPIRAGLASAVQSKESLHQLISELYVDRIEQSDILVFFDQAGVLDDVMDCIVKQENKTIDRAMGLFARWYSRELQAVPDLMKARAELGQFVGPYQLQRVITG